LQHADFNPTNPMPKLRPKKEGPHKYVAYASIITTMRLEFTASSMKQARQIVENSDGFEWIASNDGYWEEGSIEEQP